MSSLASLIQCPSLKGLVKRRVLVNFRVDPQALAPLLPAPFRPRLVDSWAMAGICLIRLEQLRPKGLPAMIGIASENAAHRIAVTWDDASGQPQHGVYIPRRDTGSPLNALAGGRVFPGEHHFARFRIRDDTSRLDLKMDTDDGSADVWLRARPARDLAASSLFTSLAEASDFFATGAVGYSVTQDRARLDGLLLRTDRWHVEPLDVDWVVSSYYADRDRFPVGSVEYDSTLIMRDLPHEWRPVAEPRVDGAETTASAPTLLSACAARSACSGAQSLRLA